MSSDGTKLLVENGLTTIFILNRQVELLGHCKMVLVYEIGRKLASSSDGTKLVAVVTGTTGMIYIYTSTDSGGLGFEDTFC